MISIQPWAKFRNFYRYSTISFEPLSLKQDCYNMFNYFPSLQFLRVKLIGIIYILVSRPERLRLLTSDLIPVTADLGSQLDTHLKC